MSRIPLISALSISLALIGGAMWFRFFPIKLPPAQIVSVPVSQQVSPENTSLEDLYNAGISLPIASTSTISQADLIGRQLFTDYMSLKSRGEASSVNLKALADKYAERVNSFDVSISKVGSERVTILPESIENLATYGHAVVNIRNKYKNLVATQVQNSEGDITDINSVAFSTLMGMIGKLYQASAEEFLLLGVPISLVPNHVSLINNYLESAEVMQSLSNTAKDPIRSYAALNIYAQHINRESELISNIQKTMTANGIIIDGMI